MKTMMKYWLGAVAMVMTVDGAIAQKIDDERMTRDIEVAENVLSTLIRNEVNKEHTFFGIEVTGGYQPGYGVTFRVPGDHNAPLIISTGQTPSGWTARVLGGSNAPTAVYYYDQGTGVIRDRQRREREAVSLEAKADMEKARKAEEKVQKAYDSARIEYNKRVIRAAKDFIADYGDFISQLAPNEKIVITNRDRRNPGYRFFSGSRTHIQVEATKADITAFRQGKISRDQLLGKITVVNTETVEERDKDLELITSIFDRLYRSDLSTTFFTDGNVYYERLKDYGATIYMQVYSSRGDGEIRLMPTQGNVEMTVDERNKRVTELYPRFERELMENILEYGRRIGSLKDNEMLMFNVTLTKCPGCGIPSTLEVSVNNSVLRDYDAGKIDRNAAVSKMTVKKGSNQ